MLISLHVKNLALIEETEVFFGPGLNILTGETGAGKSVILGSVGLALGAKADKDMIRTGADYALIELVFSVPEERKKSVEDLGVELDRDMVILSRRVMPSRSLCRVNGETVNTKTLQKLAGLLIDIHGQHDSQLLLQTKRHLEILDAYAQGTLSARKEQLQKAYRTYTAISKEIADNEMGEAERRRELSLAQFELDEIEQAALMEGEDERLEKDYRRMVNGKRIAEAMNLVHGLTGYENQEGAGEALGRALRELAPVISYDENVEAFYNQLSELDTLLNDFNRSISDYLSDIEFEEETFKNVEDRLNYINRLKDKYGNTITEIISYAKNRAEEIDRLTNQDAFLSAKRREQCEAEKKLLSCAQEVSKLRAKAAVKFAKDMQLSLQDLNFLYVQFSVSLSKKDHCGPDGMDDAVFVISTNPGEPLKPLASIASGGELSRIMLALKTITAKQETVGTFIFDEIDAGISGKTAWKVSQKLGLLAKSHQIICITHLPQIAAMADNHYYIEKNAVGSKTATTITGLSGEDSLKELARLSGAAELTETVMENARQMKELAEKNK